MSLTINSAESPGNLVRTNAEAFFNETNGQPIHFQLVPYPSSELLGAVEVADRGAYREGRREITTWKMKADINDPQIKWITQIMKSFENRNGDQKLFLVAPLPLTFSARSELSKRNLRNLSNGRINWFPGFAAHDLQPQT